MAIKMKNNSESFPWDATQATVRFDKRSLHMFQKTRSDMQDPVLHHLLQIKVARSTVKTEYFVPKSPEPTYTHQETESYEDLQFSYRQDGFNLSWGLRNKIARKHPRDKHQSQQVLLLISDGPLHP